METSYNGWTADPSPKFFGGLDNRAVVGVKMAPGVRAGDVATVLFHVAEEFHKRVEPLGTGCWGYAYRQNRNAANLSCHASATAIDLNAPKHPNGKRGTFNAAQVKAIRQILAEVGGTVRWGGDFTGTADEMHFEIVATPARVATVAAQLNAPDKGLVKDAGTAPGATPVSEEDEVDPATKAQIDSVTAWLDPNNGTLTKMVRDISALLTTPLPTAVQNGSSFAAPPLEYIRLIDAATFYTRQEVAGLRGALDVLAAKVGEQGGITAAEITQTIEQAMAKVVHVEVSVGDQP